MNDIIKYFKAHAVHFWLLAITGLVVIVVFSTYVRPAAPIIDPAADVFRSPDDLECTAALPTVTTGVDERTKEKFKSCTDGNIIITARENEAPIGFEQTGGTFLTPTEIAGYVR